VVLGRLFVRPLNRLIDGIREVDAGRDDIVLEVKSKDEFADLAVAFNVMFRRLKTKTTQLEGKQRAYDRLLARVLPAPARPNAGQIAVAERFDDASVLFAELTGLAELSASMPPRAALGLLNDLIGTIDDAAERNGVEKLRTVGGCYLAVSGLPVAQLDHANRIVDFALEFRRLVGRLRVARGIVLTVRIGIASGPVVGGVIGETRLTYDVFGEVVDLAKAIAAAAKDGGVALSASCHHLVHDLYPFDAAVEVPLRDGRLTTAWPLRPDVNEPDSKVTDPGERPLLMPGREHSHG
jgi:class 3 adenylate cyclase